MSRCSLFLVLAILLPPMQVAADEFSFPSSRSGQIAAAYFEAFNSGEEAMRAFIEQYRDRASLRRTPIEQRLERYAEIHGMFGTLTPHSVADEEPLTILIHSGASDGYFHVSFEIESGVPFKLSMVGFRPAEAPSGAPSRFVGWTDIDDLLERAREKTGLPALGAAVAVEGEIVASAVVGTRKAGGSVVVEIDDLFHIGSITKSVTAMLAADLVEAGVLQWDLTVGEALGDFTMQEVYENVTLRQLIDHQGGVRPYLTFNAVEMARLDALQGTSTEIRAQFLAEALAEDPIAEPGMAMHYSNAGYTLVGYIAEVATGKSWETLLDERVFEPLKLDSARTGWPASAETPDQPRGHFGNPPDLVVQDFDEYDLGHYLAPSGDVSMSVTDLARYVSAHAEGLMGEDNAVLAAATTRELHTTEFVDPNMRYTGGWIVDETPDGLERHWHNGSAGTFFAMAQIIPQTRRVAVVVMNSGAMANNSLCMELARELLARY